jgi:pimeloyl-ACP methyl ester carboxylesterase
VSAPHRVLAHSTLPGPDGGLELLDHEIEVPLDHVDPDGRTVRVFARELRSVAARKRLEVGAEQPALVYLQGGPGGRAIRPPSPAWLDKLLVEYRVIMLDQRGTGRSTPATARTLAGMIERTGAQATADYLTHFRADAIVGDAEAMRGAIVGASPWTSLGQSYGGFITLTYLSLAPGGLAECFITGGLPSPQASTREVYEHTLTTTTAVNSTYFATWPEDRAIVRRILDVLAAGTEHLPNGVALTPRLFQTVGNQLGFRNGQAQLHVSLADAFAPSSGPGDADLLTDVFLGEIARLVSFAEDPLYAVLHESIYAQGEATNWTAATVLAERPELAVDAAEPCLLGEVIQPFFFDEDPALRPFADVARILAERSDWTPLYDPDRLARNEVPVFAAIYEHDLFVPSELSLRAVREVGNVHAWLTPDYLHDGIRDGDVVLDQLLSMAAAHRVGRA